MTGQEPTVIGGRYELGELLGRGGMAEVRKAHDSRLGRTVAVKRLRTDLASDATFQARFRREAQSSASLNHPSIVSVYDTGEEMSTDGTDVAQPYIVMECVQGSTLRDILREGRKILPERALEIGSDVLAALDYSHRAGIIHRDIKPGNVMLTPAGDVKVMDFGIARAVSDASSTMTQTAAVVGTAQYLSPEQARGETVDSRSDVYSAGCLLYELLTGRPPFVGDSPVAVAYQHVRENPTPPSDHDDQLDPEIDAIVLKSLAKRVEDRYQSAAAMRADIERYLAGHPIQAVPPPPEPTAYQPAASAATALIPAAASTHAAAQGHDQDSGNRTGMMFLIGFLALLIIAGGAYIVSSLDLFEEPVEKEQVPALVGMTSKQASAAIVEAGLTVGAVTRETSETTPANRVIDQSPNQNLFVEPGSAVDFVLSLGKPEVDVPFVEGQPVDTARIEVEGVGLKVRVEPEKSDEPKDEVLRTDPPSGQSVAEGSVVTLFVSLGPAEVPAVVDLKQAAAERAIIAAGFVPEVRPDPSSTRPKGTVVDQIPAAGGTQDQGSTVTIFVSTFEKPTQTPTPTPTEPVPTEPTPTPEPTEPVPTPTAVPSTTEPAARRR
ncbi:Stk1 family PASTA domain-containing Ser/Thr kinase [Nocardioides piscis]|uniref:non-specific serine/threonine protein kinase n=1 Tax=Nocardioides piscis TaxID=2714938 RepID=A0A6G7YDQ1_9ACTN|nr:Stk1 family PASTA domain-containing Ser/Thr kinase [Nocardioides piscis]QIK74900.1 Stk1 family PASTA domain-containing Ser/Thr kinase [Nocardioides piscis]